MTIRTTVEGVVMQEGYTRDLIHGIAAMIAHLTVAMTLEPEDILATGTPSGVAAGRSPPPWLRAGHRVRVEIQGLGHLESLVIDEPQTVTSF